MNKVQIGSINTILNLFFNNNSFTNVLVLVDNNTKKHCYPLIKNSLPKHSTIVIESGEIHKNLETCTKIWSKMTEMSLDRHALLINLGGGVIGDMGGFCAATYKRGISFIQIPTTLLSQVDASVGGKLGIDFEGLKNHIGAFEIPNLVAIDAQFLETLPPIELKSGYAEVIKHSLIADKAQWELLKKMDLENANWSNLIAHSVAIKDSITTTDPTEKGLRKVLNFGHTLGHAIETYFLNTKNHLLHGEAIAAGMICEAYLAFTKKLITKAELNEIEEYLFAVYGKCALKKEDFDTIIELTKQDKKNKGNAVRFSILDGIGKCAWDITINASEMKKSLEFYIQ